MYLMDPRVTQQGVCKHTNYKHPFDCEQSNKGAWRVGAGTNISSLIDCEAMCRRCARCAYISFSHKHRECAWFASCERPAQIKSFELVAVKQLPLPAPPQHGGRQQCPRQRPSSVEGATALALPPIWPECTQHAAETLKRRLACVGDSITRGDGAHELGKGSHQPWKHTIRGRGAPYTATLQSRVSHSCHHMRCGHCY